MKIDLSKVIDLNAWREHERLITWLIIIVGFLHIFGVIELDYGFIQQLIAAIPPEAADAVAASVEVVEGEDIPVAGTTEAGSTVATGTGLTFLGMILKAIGFDLSRGKVKAAKAGFEDEG